MDDSNIKFIRRGFANAASFKGLIHVDLYLVMRRYMTLERYTLERVYYELFGEEKLMFLENTSGSTGTVIQLN